MRVPLAILFSVCIIMGLGQLMQTDATTTIEVPATAFVMDQVSIEVPTVEMPEQPAWQSSVPSELPTPPDNSFVLTVHKSRSDCDDNTCGMNQTTDTTTVENVERNRSVAGAVAGAGRCAGKIVKAAVGRERRQARRAERRE